MEDGSKEERIARGPEKRTVTIQFDDQRNGAVRWDVELVPWRAVQNDAQIGSRNWESQSRDTAVGKDRAVRRARIAAAGFEHRFPRERAGEAQPNLAVSPGRQRGIGKQRRGGVSLWVRQQIQL